ncbi:chemotaxis protein [Vibrio parahaemolyticus]|uniref:chemotaxis protein n=1 Tax=Vibrio parahaemolyticus TaxID=670 RepID=UPI001120A3B7|nr:chemotaxis protein [Vibrio parahaemolyticus]TOJ25223.1 chemotaxis protein [Vibrio parahaemolyticus]TOJ59672.1 chemotaxis protein [Vibrio parahaemolyticus]
MSIKQSIASLVILLSVSFSASASGGFIKLYRNGGNSHLVNGCLGVSIGDTMKIGTSGELNKRYSNGVCESWSVNASRVSVTWKRDGAGYYGGSIEGASAASCPSGQVVNPDTGKCEEPPVPFCEKPDTINQMNQFKDSCFAKGNGWSPDVSCSDATESLSMTCNPPPPESCEPGSPSFPACLDDDSKCDETHPDWNPEYGMCCTPENNWCDVPPPESCTIFSPNWPECSGDTDIDPPTGGDLGDPDKPSGGGGGGSTDPDKPEPDVDNTSDTLAAIKAMNKDVNSQLTGINNDMNKNQAETKSALDALKASVDLNTDTVVDNANHVANAINGQSDMLSDIGNQTNGLLTSANNLLNNGFGQLSNELGDLEATNQKGFGDVVDAIEGLGKPMVDGGGGGAVVPLYSATQLHNLNAEITVLKNEYKDLLNQYRAYFNFTSDVNGGDYNAHNIELTVRGNVVRQQNAVMAALQDNAGIIGAVVLFVFGLLGIRAIGGAF